MLKKVLVIIALSSAMFASSAANLYSSKCASCHGTKGEKKALGKSDVINKMSVAKLTTLLKGYKTGKENLHGMGALMKGQVANLSDSEIKNLATYIHSLGK